MALHPRRASLTFFPCCACPRSRFSGIVFTCGIAARRSGGGHRRRGSTATPRRPTTGSGRGRRSIRRRSARQVARRRGGGGAGAAANGLRPDRREPHSVRPPISVEALPFLPVRLLVTQRFDSIAKVGSLAVPKLFIHARQDEIIPFSHGERLFRAAAEPKRFVALRGGHNDAFLLPENAYPGDPRPVLRRGFRRGPSKPATESSAAPCGREGGPRRRARRTVRRAESCSLRRRLLVYAFP